MQTEKFCHEGSGVKSALKRDHVICKTLMYGFKNTPKTKQKKNQEEVKG